MAEQTPSFAIHVSLVSAAQAPPLFSMHCCGLGWQCTYMQGRNCGCFTGEVDRSTFIYFKLYFYAHFLFTFIRSFIDPHVRIEMWRMITAAAMKREPQPHTCPTTQELQAIVPVEREQQSAESRFGTAYHHPGCPSSSCTSGSKAPPPGGGCPNARQ